MFDDNDNLKAFYGIEESQEEPAAAPKDHQAPKKKLFDRLTTRARELATNTHDSPTSLTPISKSTSLDEDISAPIGSLDIDEQSAKQTFKEAAQKKEAEQAELKAQEIALKKQIKEAEQRLAQEKIQKEKQAKIELKQNQEREKENLNNSLSQAVLSDDLDLVKAIVSIPGYKINIDTLRESIEFTVPAKTNSKAIATLVSNAVEKTSDLETVIKEFAQKNKLAQINNLQDSNFFLNKNAEALVAINTLNKDNNLLSANLMLDQLNIAQKTFGSLPLIQSKADQYAKASFQQAIKTNDHQEITELLNNDLFKTNIFPDLIENGLKTTLENGSKETFALISKETKQKPNNEEKLRNVLNQYSNNDEVGKLSKAMEFNPDLKSLVNPDTVKQVESYERIRNPQTIYGDGNSLIRDIKALEENSKLKDFEGNSLSSSLRELPHVSARASQGLKEYIKKAEIVSKNDEFRQDLISFAKYSNLTKDHPALKDAIESQDIRVLNIIKFEYKKQNNGQEIPDAIVKGEYKESLVKGNLKQADFIEQSFRGLSLNRDQQVLKEAIAQVTDPIILTTLATNERYKTGESITDIKIFKTCIDHALDNHDAKSLTNLFANEQFGKLVEEPQNAKQIEPILKDERATDLLLGSKDLEATANLQKAVHELSKTLESKTQDLHTEINKLTLKDFDKNNLTTTIKKFESHIEQGANATSKEVIDALVKKQGELNKKNEGFFGKKNQNLGQGLAKIANVLQKSAIDNKINKMRQNLSENSISIGSNIVSSNSKAPSQGKGR